MKAVCDGVDFHLVLKRASSWAERPPPKCCFALFEKFDACRQSVGRKKFQTRKQFISQCLISIFSPLSESHASIFIYFLVCKLKSIKKVGSDTVFCASLIFCLLGCQNTFLSFSQLIAQLVMLCVFCCFFQNTVWAVWVFFPHPSPL